MALICGDFETYYSTEYSLKRMTTAEYLMDERFEATICAIKEGARPSRALVGADEMQAYFDAVDWSQTDFLSHNIFFDGAVLFWRFGKIPRRYVCTMSLSRALLHYKTKASSLAAVAKYFGLPDKGFISTFKGKTLAMIKAEGLLPAYIEYCLHDNELAHAAFLRLAPELPDQEWDVIDLVARMAVIPQLRLNLDKLCAHLATVQATKQAELDRVLGHADKDTLSSNVKFAALLETLGVQVPMKASPTVPGKIIPALAIGDSAFKDLLEDTSQPIVVQAVLAARKGVKSVLEETRTETLIDIARATGGWLPVPLKYGSTQTYRLAGDGDINMQNTTRNSGIDTAIEAPEGKVIVYRDSSQIECRLLATVAGALNLLQAFAKGEDEYSNFASEMYHTPVSKALAKVDKKVEGYRFTGKVSILQLGYGAGETSLQNSLWTRGNLRVPTQECIQAKLLFRRKYDAIPRLWRANDAMLDAMVDTEAGRQGRHVEGQPVARDDRRYGSHGFPPGERPEGIPFEYVLSGDKVPYRFGTEYIALPSGMKLRYPHLRCVGPDDDTYDEGDMVYIGLHGGRKKVYGGAVTENIIQALAYIVISDIILRVRASPWGLRPAIQKHDSLGYVVDADRAMEFDHYLEQQFAVVPPWAWTRPIDGQVYPCPLASEGFIGKTLAG